MAIQNKQSSLKGREMPNHKYISRTWKDDKWVYVYEAPKTKLANITPDISPSAPTKSQGYTNRKTGSWVEQYKRIKNMTVNSISSTPTVENGKTAVGRAGLKLDNRMNYAAIASGITKEKYEETTKKLKDELDKKKSSNESHFRQLFTNETATYRNKLLQQLTRKYGNDIPESETKKLDKTMEDYSKKLWDDVYQKKLDETNSTDQLKYEQTDRYLKKNIRKDKEKK